MGTYARRRPERLAEKLLAVREAFGDSQNGLIRRLGLGCYESVTRTRRLSTNSRFGLNQSQDAAKSPESCLVTWGLLLFWRGLRSQYHSRKRMG